MVSKTYRNIEATEAYFTEVEFLNILCGLYWKIPENMAEVKEYFTTKVDNKTQWIVDFLKALRKTSAQARKTRGVQI